LDFPPSHAKKFWTKQLALFAARPAITMLHRLFSAATSAAALKGKSLAVEEEEIARSRQMLYGYRKLRSSEADGNRFLPETPGDPCVGARVLILKDEAGRKDKVYLYDSQKDERIFCSGRYSPPPKRVGVAHD
jgi:hypothetical protein